ncbi:MAG TPA: cupin domain-containing protein [Methanocorpusculum sp.]|nr:cupin domain-containing protein [Methanocorpusculum sp.]HKL97043.1 cupin domain-containing protein [Methanocorpusculum sp.]
MTIFVTTLDQTEISDTPHKVDVRKIHGSESTDIVVITLQPGESLKRHITQVDVLFYVLEGKGKVIIGDEETEVEKDSLIQSPRKVPHLLVNTSDKLFRFMVIKMLTTGDGKNMKTQIL